MNSTIKNLKNSLSRLDRFVNKKNSLDEKATIELSDIVQDMIALQNNIDSFINCIKAQKDTKVYKKIKRQQEIEEKIFKKFMPFIVAYNILLNQETVDT